jgi:hypothetical protein
LFPRELGSFLEERILFPGEATFSLGNLGLLNESTLLPKEIAFLSMELGPFLGKNSLSPREFLFFLVQAFFQTISFVP